MDLSLKYLLKLSFILGGPQIYILPASAKLNPSYKISSNLVSLSLKYLLDSSLAINGLFVSLARRVNVKLSED